MGSPRLTKTPDGYRCELEQGVCLEFLRLRPARGGVHSGIWADTVASVKRGDEWIPLHEGRYNLSSASTRRELAKFLSARIRLPDTQDETAWLDIVDSLCSGVCRAGRQGKVPVCLGDRADPGPPRYLVEKLLEDGQLTVLYGEKSSGKSQLALAVAYAVHEGVDGLLGLVVHPRPVLYLDWETGEDEQVRRLHRMARGLGAPSIAFIDYLAMDRPLADEADSLRVRAAGKLLIIDSLVPACGGDAREESATAFWHAIRNINATVLCVAQTQKNEQRGKRPRTVFGSVMFEYAARSIWLARRYQEADSTDLHLVLIHEKSNNGPLLKPMAWCLRFASNATAFETEDPKAVPEFADVIPVKDSIKEVLKGGARTVGDISAELEMTDDNVRSQLNRHKQDFIKLEDKRWGLRERNVSEQAIT